MSDALAGRRIVLSAGPTYEDIDPVRFIGNRSSGKMGFAIAAAAVRRGARVVLVAGPVQLATPAGVERIDVRSAAQMHAAVMAALPADIYIGAAAVADFAPRAVAEDKIKKPVEGPHADVRALASDSHRLTDDGLTLELVRTRDILADVAAHARRPRLVVGFAAETHDVERYARDKLQRKRVDMIAANRVGIEGSGFECDDNTLAVYWPGGERVLGPASKQQVADGLLGLVADRFAALPA